MTYGWLFKPIGWVGKTIHRKDLCVYFCRQQSVASLRCMPSHFHLLQAAEVSLHEGSLEGIDALLGTYVA